MPSSNKRLIPLALLIAIGMGVILFVLQLSESESPETYPLVGVWASSFESGYQIDKAEGAYRVPEGVVLSHIHVTETSCPYFYDAATNQCLAVDTTKLVGKDEYLGKLVMARDGRIYAAIGSQKRGVDARLRVFDPATKQSRDLGAIIPGEYHPIDIVATSDGHIYGVVDDHLFTYDPTTNITTDLGIPLNAKGYISGLALSDDQHLYGTIGDYQGKQLFDYDLATRQVVSLTSNIWNSTINTLVLSSDKKIYGISARANHGLMYYDLVQHQVRELSQPAGWETAWDIAAAPDGTIYGVTSRYPTSENFLFRYSLAADQPIYLEPLPNLYRSTYLTIHPNGRLYFSQEKTHFVYDEHAYVQQGAITSELIEPHHLAVSQATIGEGPIGIGQLAWGSDGAIYGTTSRVWQSDGSWLFRYALAAILFR